MTGAAMDRVLPRRNRRPLVLGGGFAMLGCVIVLAWQLLPDGLRVSANDVRLAVVEQGAMRNDLVVRAMVAPLNTIMLDVVDSGRVEEVLARDGAIVRKGELLVRLSNPQRRLDLVARQADRAQQISNLSTIREALEASRTAFERRLLELSFASAQAQRVYLRNQTLAQQGFISESSLEESREAAAQQLQSIENEKSRFAIEAKIKQNAVQQMEQAIRQLDGGLAVVSNSIEALNVRAPINGRLTDFDLQLGEIVKSDRRIGRIDDPDGIKLVAQIDEYHLGQVVVGKPGRVLVDGRDYSVEVSRVFPQIKEGRFSIELVFPHEAPRSMRPGQSAETQIVLGASSAGLVLPNDAFVNDSGGNWIFVVSSDGKSAERRPIRVGRRNNSQLEVVSGLSAGERVIVSSYTQFSKFQRLQIHGL